MPARLTIYPPDQPALHFPLDAKRAHLIGRGADCDLCIDDTRLSRRHARLTLAGARWRLRDLDSKNGTMLPGQAPGACALSDGDWISFGGLLGRFAILSDERLAAEEQLARTRWDDTIDLSRRLDPHADVDVLLNQILHASLELAGAQRGFVMLADPGGRLQVQARAGDPAAHDAGSIFPGSRTALARALATRAPVVACDTSADTLLGARPSIVAGQIRALVCLPLTVGEQLTGLIYLDSALPGKFFTRLDVEILEAFAAHAALVICAASLRQELSGLVELLPREMCRGPLPEVLLRELQSALPSAPSIGLPDGAPP